MIWPRTSRSPRGIRRGRITCCPPAPRDAPTCRSSRRRARGSGEICADDGDCRLADPFGRAGAERLVRPRPDQCLRHEAEMPVPPAETPDLRERLRVLRPAVAEHDRPPAHRSLPTEAAWPRQRRGFGRAAEAAERVRVLERRVVVVDARRACRPSVTVPTWPWQASRSAFVEQLAVLAARRRRCRSRRARSRRASAALRRVEPVRHGGIGGSGSCRAVCGWPSQASCISWAAASRLRVVERVEQRRRR